MSGFSNTLANNIINSTLRGIGWVGVNTTYFALFTADPTDAFTAGTEVSAAWYIRKATGAFSAPVNGVSYNTTQVAFPAVTGASTTVTHIGIVSGTSANDAGAVLLYSQALSTPKTLTVNDVFVVDTGSGTGDFTLSLM